MVNKLTALYNTMAMIETKGENTVLMGDCLKYVKQLIVEEQTKPVGEEAPVAE